LIGCHRSTGDIRLAPDSGAYRVWLAGARRVRALRVLYEQVTPN